MSSRGPLAAPVRGKPRNLKFEGTFPRATEREAVIRIRWALGFLMFRICLAGFGIVVTFNSPADLNVFRSHMIVALVLVSVAIGLHRRSYTAVVGLLAFDILNLANSLLSVHPRTFLYLLYIHIDWRALTGVRMSRAQDLPDALAQRLRAGEKHYRSNARGALVLALLIGAFTTAMVLAEGSGMLLAVAFGAGIGVLSYPFQLLIRTFQPPDDDGGRE